MVKTTNQAEKEYVYIEDRSIFNVAQKRQLKRCVALKLDVSVIADPEFSAEQMRELRLGMLRGVDYTRYCDKNLPARIMYIARKELEHKGMTKAAEAYYISEKAKEAGYSANIASIFFKGAMKGVNLFDVITEQKYNRKHLLAISRALVLGNPALKDYLNPSDNWRELVTSNAYYKFTKDEKGAKPYDYHQMFQINAGLRRNVDIRPFIDSSFNWRKMKEIRLGLQEGIDVSKYANVKNNSFKMRELRLALCDNIDLSSLIKPCDNWQLIKRSRIFFTKMYDITEYTVEQLQEIMKCLRLGFDVKEAAKPGFDHKKLEQLRLSNALPYAQLEC